MARWTQDVYLMEGTNGTYSRLVDIKDYPDLGSEPEMIEVTTLSALRFKEYIQGLMDTGSLTFTCNYDKEDYARVKAKESGGVQPFALFFGITGQDGMFYWDGELRAWITGKGTNEAAEFTVSISVSEEIRETATQTP